MLFFSTYLFSVPGPVFVRSYLVDFSSVEFGLSGVLWSGLVDICHLGGMVFD